jgi:hypothetical protein
MSVPGRHFGVIANADRLICVLQRQHREKFCPYGSESLFSTQCRHAEQMTWIENKTKCISSHPYRFAMEFAGEQIRAKRSGINLGGNVAISLPAVVTVQVSGNRRA